MDGRDSSVRLPDKAQTVAAKYRQLQTGMSETLSLSNPSSSQHVGLTRTVF
jgi:hypothetical protein